MKYIIEPNQLTIKLEGFEKLWALKSRLQIPVYAIAMIDFVAEQPMVQDFKGFLRLPGIALPWRFYAGSHRKGSEREFWYVRMKQSGVLVVTLKSGTLSYSKVRLTCTPGIAQEIVDWWQASK